MPSSGRLSIQHSVEPLRGVEVYEEGSTTYYAPVNHDNNYRGFEIYNDTEEEPLDLDEIDMQHLAATAHPKMKSRCMHADPTLIGLPTYTQVVKADMDRLRGFIEKEVSSSVITEFAQRVTGRLDQSYDALMSVHRRYKQVSATMLKDEHSLLEGDTHVPTNVTGLEGLLDPQASRRQKHLSRTVVRELLSQPALLKAPHRANKPPRLRPHNINSVARHNFEHEYSDRHGGLSGEVYAAIGASGGVWDGTVYKRTLLLSLYRKLRYKLYFDALRHHYEAIKNARLSVLSVAARRLSKMYKLCFQAILAEFLVAKYTTSRAELAVNLYIVQRVYWPALECLDKSRRNRVQRRNGYQRAVVKRRLLKERHFVKRLHRLRNSRKFVDLVLQISALTRRAYHFRHLLSRLRGLRDWRLAFEVSEAKVDEMVQNRYLRQPLQAIAQYARASQCVKDISGRSISHWSRREALSCFQHWVRFTMLSRRRGWARDTAVWEQRRRLSIGPLEKWSIFVGKKRRHKLKILRMSRLLSNDKFRETLNLWKRLRTFRKHARFCAQKANSALWKRDAKKGLKSLRRCALLGRYTTHTEKRAAIFAKSAAGLEGVASLIANAKAAERLRIGNQLADMGSQLIAQLEVLWVLRVMRATRGRARVLAQWAPRHGADSLARKVFSAWMLAFIRQSSMRAALEKRVNSAERVGTDKGAVGDMLGVLGVGTDAAELRAGLVKLRDASIARVSITKRRVMKNLHDSLEERFGNKNVPLAPLAQERIAFIKQRLVTLTQSSVRTTFGAIPGSSLKKKNSSWRAISQLQYYDLEQLEAKLGAADTNSAALGDSNDHAHRGATVEEKLGSGVSRLAHSGVRTFTGHDRAPMVVRSQLRIGAGTSRQSALENDSSDDDSASTHRAFTGAVDAENTREHLVLEESMLHRLFTQARSLPRKRRYPLETRSDYLLSVSMAAPGIGAGMSSQPFPHENCSSLGISTTMNESSDVQNLDVQNLSDALHSFSTDNSFAAQCTAALLDKSFELSTRVGGLSVGGFFFMAMTGTSSYAFARDAKAVQKNDDNVTKVGDTKDDIAHSLDAATLLIQASHWALLKLRRFARHGIADRRVRARKRTQHLQRIVNTWKSTHQKLQQTFNLCDQVWGAAAARRVLQQLRLCVRSTSAQLKGLHKRLNRLYAQHALRDWKYLYHLVHAETIVQRRNHQYHLQLMLGNWQWCYRHIPGMVRLRKKMMRRTLYPCINLWKLKTKNLRKLRCVFELFEISWHKRWLLVCGRSEKSRLFECYDSWIFFVHLVKEERHAEQQMRKALIFRSAALRAKCFMHWLDFHLSCLLEKRARLSKLQMFQRVFLHHCKEVTDVMKIKSQKGDSHFANRHLKRHLLAWWREAHEQQVLLPQLIKRKYLLRLSWRCLRMQRRIRLLQKVLLPKQKLERTRKLFYAWHGLFTRKINIDYACTKLEHALWQMRVRGILEQWPGRAAFQRAEKMREYMEKKGRSKVVLVDIKEQESEQRKAALKKLEQEEKNRSFLSMRKAAPLERRAALFGYIYSAEDPSAVEDLFHVLRAILYAWQDQAHTDAFLRGAERLVRFRHKRAVVEQSLRTWIGKCPATSHRLSLWISKKFAKNANRKLMLESNAVATKHLVSQYAKLGLDDLVRMEE